MNSISPLRAIMILCVLTTVHGLSRRVVCQRACPKLYSPVCGTDGITYTNPCELTVAACSNSRGVSISLAYGGECQKPVITQAVNPCTVSCPEIYAPVCGADGHTYPSVCYLKLENCKRKGNHQVSVVSDGPCRGQVNPAPLEECPTFCTFDYTPVCGSDGKTYGNLCSLNAANCGKDDADKVTKAYLGECTTNTRSSDCNMRCYKIYDPVCGSDGVTYASACYLNSSNCGKADSDKVTLVHEGQCATTPAAPVEKVECPMICPAIYAPVCGSDNFTYASACNLNAANCTKPSNAKIVGFYEGECRSTRVTVDCLQICPAIYAPVCGSDSVTYASICNLKAVNCSRPANAKIRSYSSGECTAATVTRPCPKLCAMVYNPVCGSDGVTYPNECTFNARTCGRSGITKAYKGECRINGWAVKSIG
ncbi:unnamed protein product [Lymnaea stagnalis]|uniref:Kazal-like domain-containing protein n=1 Tax=Lymnaea stagnalis TaxID=6523 RepID=A0AAV2IGK0_LYMST